jgi:glycosyltransferase involved in cell wall biosynthesis
MDVERAQPADLTVSVIVPTFNRCSRLERLLLAIDRLPESRTGLEVIVAVDGATDGTMEMLHSIRLGYSLRVIEQPNRGPSAARNAALAAATGDVVLFLDDDVIPTEVVVSEHLRHHRLDPRAAVIGPMIAPPGLRLSPWLQWETTIVGRQYEGLQTGRWKPTERFFYTGNASVRRELALAIGGFNEQFTRHTDREFALRLAALPVTFYFAPDAIVHHEPDRTFATWMHVAYEYGRHAALFENGVAPNYLSEMRQESRQRNALSRALTRWSVGHRLRRRAVTTLFGWFITQPAFDHAVRIKLWLCSGLWNVLYWQGAADMTNLGAGIWRTLDARQHRAGRTEAGSRTG